MSLSSKCSTFLTNFFYNILYFVVKKEIIFIKLPFYVEKVQRAFEQIISSTSFFVSLKDEQKEIEEDLNAVGFVIDVFTEKEANH